MDCQNPAQRLVYPDTVNYHVIKACNYHCTFCFDTFDDVQQADRIQRPFHEKVVASLASYFGRINFVGGEPLLVPHLPSLIRLAKSHGLNTSIVTNALLLDSDWLKACQGSLDIVGISMDSQNAAVLEQLGRANNRSRPLSLQEYEARMMLVKRLNIDLKINIVVNRLNWQEDFRPFLRRIRPSRVKFMQLLPMAGQNDGEIDDLVVSSEEYETCWRRHASLQDEGISVPFEPNELMLTSYAMVDPWGRFFDTSTGRHLYSAPILRVGVQSAWRSVRFSERAYLDRGGDWISAGTTRQTAAQLG